MVIGTARLRPWPARSPTPRFPRLIAGSSHLDHPAGRDLISGRARHDEQLGPVQLTAIADALVADASPWPSVTGGVRREWYLVTATEAYEAYVITWPPGGSLNLHDHGDSAGAVVVIDGELVETAVSEVSPGVVATSSTRVPAGGSVAFAGHHVHDITNNSSTTPARSVHVYSPRLTTMTHYRLDGSTLRAEVTERYHHGTAVG